MKPYLFTYSGLCPEWNAQAVLDRTAAVRNWVQPFPNAAIVISDLEDARELAAVLRVHLGDTWFLISEMNSSKVDGWLPEDLWRFVNSPPNAFLPAFPSHATPPPPPPVRRSGTSG